jgi:hypothetical protein
MTYERAIEIIEKEFSLRDNSLNTKIIKTGMTYDGANSFCVCLYNSDKGVIITDLGKTKDIFDEVTKEEWESLCKEHNFKFEHWKIVRDFVSVKDVYDFIEFLDFISNKYWDEVQDETD